jgi:TonB family protein
LSPQHSEFTGPQHVAFTDCCLGFRVPFLTLFLSSVESGNTIHGMQKLLRFLSITLLSPFLIAHAHAQATAHTSLPQPSDMKLGVELLTDTNGASVDPYMKNLISDLRKHWLPLASEAANHPLVKQEETVLSLSIGPGRILAMQLEGSTHDTALDRAAWSAAKGTSYLPPPTGIRGPDLKLRVHFTVN